ncbi:MAG: glycosyltransferase [Clostridia bacterium]|nr:glycosyltransferase [Clostridia bacterium]
MSLNIIILANKYPNAVEPNVNVFTQQIAWSFADQGCRCIVICPLALNYDKRNKTLPQSETETTEKSNTVQVYRPYYLGLGQESKKLQKFRVAVTTRAYIAAAEKVLRMLNLTDAVLFAEFLCPAGVAASVLGKKYNVRSFMQCGEATYQGDKKYGNQKLRDKLLCHLTGVIALSGQNRDYLVNAGVVPNEKVIILPSGYRRDRIYQRDKLQARKKLGLPEDKFIVGFCGSYDVRKGVLRLEKAVDMIEDPDVCLAAVGRGTCMPTSPKCVWTGTINHEELAWFYSAVDVFAFPTYNEGCCTAIVEAIACGCPIISSDRPFNYEICNPTNSILIDPDDIEAMKNSILLLKNNPELRQSLSEGSLQMSQSLSLDEKAQRAIEFMNRAC